MAATSYGVNHPLAVKVWARTLFEETLKETFVNRFIGSSSSALITKKTELQKSAGDRITVGLRMLLNGAGVQGDETLEGNEEALITYSDNVFINQLRNAVRSGGKMSEQRVPFSVREEAMQGLRDWLADRIDTSFANQIAGYTSQADTKYTGNNATVAPTSATATSRIFIAGFGTHADTTEASLSATTTHALKLVDIDRAVAKAATASPLIRPLRIKGDEYYVLFVHPNAMLQLRRDASTAGNYIDIHKAQLQGGKIGDNPILTGADFIYNKTIVYEWTRLPNTVGLADNTNFRRNVFCGAQAAMIAFGGYSSGVEADWKEELFDYGNQLGVGGGLIWGMKKAVFNSVDFSTIVISSYAPTA